MSRVVLLGKPGCHLCDDARAVVSDVCTELGIEWEERDILTDPGLADRYWDEIPVVLVDGVRHSFWTVDPARLRASLTGDTPAR